MTPAFRAAALPLLLAIGPAALQPAAAQAISTDYAAAPAGAYALDPAHTSVILKVSHLGLSSYTFRMSGVRGGFSFDPARPEASKLQVEIDSASVDTGDPAFNHQIAEDVLGASKYPTISFVSNAVKPEREGRGEVVGDLTLHGQTHPVTLDVVFNGFAPSPQEKAVRMGFSADATVRRSEYGAGKYAPMVGDEVSLAIETEFKTSAR
ncbi:YceI family protein [Caulobacter sp. S45]|uniref:YceI family protein n=1 Tax=Caulobacter sp. S45 TaxID=1641861 RepID=UPI001576E7D9|nr:YceI family protein [Caulobacter sp. S45]